MNEKAQRDVRDEPVFDEDRSRCGWVRLDADRIAGPNATDYCINIETTSYRLSPFEARAFARALEKQATEAERLRNAR